VENDRPTLPAPVVDRAGLRRALEAAGWRCTPQRWAVYTYLVQAAHHPAAEEIFHAVQAAVPQISLATIYKALEALVASGLATKLTAGDGSARYDARSDRHYHLRCLRSGAVEDLPTAYDPDLIAKLDPDLADQLGRRGFRVTGYRLEVVGYFDELPSAAAARPRPDPA
jgi:Fe2+ or Zn2+ uptake regulation protein